MSKKVDVTISKNVTINTGNYQSIRPSISITVHDVDSSNLERATQVLSEFTEDLLRLEVVKSSTILDDMRKEGGLVSYCTSILDQIDSIEERLDKNMGIINKLS